MDAGGAQRPADGEQHGIAEPAAGQQHRLAARRLRRRAGRAHQDHGLAGLQQRAEIGRAAHLQHDGARPGPCRGSTQAPVSARPSIASVVPSTRWRERLEILQAVELAGLEVARGLRRAHHHLDDGRRQAVDRDARAARSRSVQARR